MSKQSTVAKAHELCRCVESVWCLKVDADITDDQVAHLFLQFKCSPNTSWWMALVQHKYHTTRTTNHQTFFRSAARAAFKRFQQPTRYSKTVKSVGTLERKWRYSSSCLKHYQWCGTDLEWGTYSGDWEFNSRRAITTDSKLSAFRRRLPVETMFMVNQNCIQIEVKIPSGDSSSTADRSQTYSNSVFMASAGFPPRISKYSTT